jgi:hypothetical protein
MISENGSLFSWEYFVWTFSGKLKYTQMGG